MCHSNATASQTPRTSALADIRVHIPSVVRHKRTGILFPNATPDARRFRRRLWASEKVEFGNLFDESVNYEQS